MMSKGKSDNAPTPLVEGLDYYLEEGKYVFTAHFLSSRGYCCGSACRHCPYNSDGKIKPQGD